MTSTRSSTLHFHYSKNNIQYSRKHEAESSGMFSQYCTRSKVFTGFKWYMYSYGLLYHDIPFNSDNGYRSKNDLYQVDTFWVDVFMEFILQALNILYEVGTLYRFKHGKNRKVPFSESDAKFLERYLSLSLSLFILFLPKKYDISELNCAANLSLFIS